MDKFLKALEAYEKFDPAGWVAVYKTLPLAAGVAVAVVGLLMLLLGNGHLFRVVAAPLGALVATLWAAGIATRLGYEGDAHRVTAIATVVLVVLGIGWPPGVVFFAVGIPAGLFAGEFVGRQDWLLGFIPGFIGMGGLAVAAHRWFSAIVSSFAGAWLLVIGVLAALRESTSLAEKVTSTPWGALGAAALFGLAGSVYQLFVRLSPEERAAVKEEKARTKRKLKEQKALEQRWASYSKRQDDD